MNHTTAIAALSAAALLAGATLAGCRNDDEPEVSTTESIEDGMNAGRLAGVPEEVRTSVMADMDANAGYTIESVEPQPVAGGMQYRVTYFDGNGGVESRTYDRDGLRIVTPSERAAQNAEPSEPIEQRASDSTVATDRSDEIIEGSGDPAMQQNQQNQQNSGGPLGGGGNLPPDGR